MNQKTEKTYEVRPGQSVELLKELQAEFHMAMLLLQFNGPCPDIIAVIKGDGPFVLQLQHQLNMQVHTFITAADIFFGVLFA